MPELPEIETVKRTLTPLLVGERFHEINILNPVVVKYPEADRFTTELSGRSVTAIERRGKYLQILLDNGGRLVVHLRMTGRITCVEPEEPMLPHTHLIAVLDHRELRYSDVRRFGGLWYLAPNESDQVTGMQNLGIEPLVQEFSGSYMFQKLSVSKKAVKSAILDQHILAGVGNIYADESLFACGISPTRKCSDLKITEWDSLVAEMKKILHDAIGRRGTTFSDYLDAEGHKGYNQAYLKVYQRDGEPCLNCGTLLEKIRVAGRGTCFCPKCQK